MGLAFKNFDQTISLTGYKPFHEKECLPDANNKNKLISRLFSLRIGK